MEKNSERRAGCNSEKDTGRTRVEDGKRFRTLTRVQVGERFNMEKDSGRGEI